MASSLPTRLHSSDVAFDSVAAVESWTNGSSSSPGPELFVTADTFAVLSGLAARPPRRAAQISARPAVRGWIGAQLVLLLLTCSPRGVALATALVRVAGVALRHVAALVAAALGPRRCHPRRPAALIHIAAALVAPLPLSPPPSTPRRRRPRRRRPRALDAAALDAAAHTAALHIQRCGSACTVTIIVRGVTTVQCVCVPGQSWVTHAFVCMF